MKQPHKYNQYKEYVEHQLEKTGDKTKQYKWKNNEWRLKIDIFKRLFQENIKIIEESKKALCLASRTGQEVVALKELGVQDTTGIDLHEFPPYTLKGDFHNLQFGDNVFDLEFTNSLDHVLFPVQFVSEIRRTLKPKGIFILHMQLGIDQDKYTELVIEDLKELKALFYRFKVIKENKIESGIMAMNYEIIFEK